MNQSNQSIYQIHLSVSPNWLLRNSFKSPTATHPKRQSTSLCLRSWSWKTLTFWRIDKLIVGLMVASIVFICARHNSSETQLREHTVNERSNSPGRYWCGGKKMKTKLCFTSKAQWGSSFSEILNTEKTCIWAGDSNLKTHTHTHIWEPSQWEKRSISLCLCLLMASSIMAHHGGVYRHTNVHTETIIPFKPRAAN